MKEQNELKMKAEIERQREDLLREKEEKRDARQKFLLSLKEEEERNRAEEERRRQLEIAKAEKEQQLRTRAERCQAAQDRQRQKTIERSEAVNAKYAQQQQRLEERKSEQRQVQELKRAEKELVVERAFMPKRKREEDRNMQFTMKKQLESEREEKMKREREREQVQIHMRAEERNLKKERTLALSERRQQERIISLLEKQHEADERMEAQRTRKRRLELIKRELVALKNQSKDYNRERAQRRHAYKEQQLRFKIQEEGMRHNAMQEEKHHLKNVRMKALFDMEKQRGDVRNALYQMSVWNTYASDIVNTIFHAESGVAPSSTIDELVRLKAIEAQRKRKQEAALHGRAGSTISHFAQIREEEEYAGENEGVRIRRVQGSERKNHAGRSPGDESSSSPQKAQAAPNPVARGGHPSGSITDRPKPVSSGPAMNLRIGGVKKGTWSKPTMAGGKIGASGGTTAPSEGSLYAPPGVPALGRGLDYGNREGGGAKTERLPERSRANEERKTQSSEWTTPRGVLKSVKKEEEASGVEIGSVEREKRHDEGRFGAGSRAREETSTPRHLGSEYGGLGSTPERLPQEEEEPGVHEEEHAYSEVEGEVNGVVGEQHEAKY